MMRRGVVLVAVAAAASGFGDVSSWCALGGSGCSSNGDSLANCALPQGGTRPQCFCSSGYTFPNQFKGKCVQEGPVTHTTEMVASVRFGSSFACGEFGSGEEAELRLAFKALLVEPKLVAKKCPTLTVGVAMELPVGQAEALERRELVKTLNAMVRNPQNAQFARLRALPEMTGTLAAEGGRCQMAHATHTLEDHLGRCSAMACVDGSQLVESSDIATCAPPPARSTDSDDDWTHWEMFGVVVGCSAVLVVVVIIVLVACGCCSRKGGKKAASEPRTPSGEGGPPPMPQSPLPPLQPEDREAGDMAVAPYATGTSPYIDELTYSEQPEDYLV